MIVAYLDHSGFHLELDTCCLLFDYHTGDIPVSDKPLYVFVSHSHFDHFNPSIVHLDATFIVHDKVDMQGTNIHYVQPQKQYNVNDLFIQTLYSTDEGVAFLVQVEDKTIYHAGDLHLWHWEGEENWDNDVQEKKYKQYLQPLLPYTIDVAFVVLDPRLKEYYALGMHYFIKTMNVKHVFPMHMWDEYTIIETYNKKYPEDSVHTISKKQERFVI